MSESRQPPVNTLKEIGIPVLKMIGVVAVTAAIVVLIIKLTKSHQNSNPQKSGVDQPQKFRSVISGEFGKHLPRDLLSER